MRSCMATWLTIAALVLFPTLGATALETPGEEVPEAAQPVSLTLVAVGDVMMHDLQVRSARQADGRYDLGHAFAPIEGIIAGADIAFANLESPLGGEDMAFSGYPTFNAPRDLASTLFDAGFDVVQTANNHCMDRREKGLGRTLAALDAEGLLHAGTRTDPDADPAVWIEHEGAKLAFLAYTFSTNGIPLPPGREGIVSVIDAKQMAADIAAAREGGADVVVVACHWGIEYRHEPESETVVLAHELVEAGADIILGGHPHFIQPYELITASDGHEAFVIYSLGNFLTNMRKRYQDAGMVLQLHLEIRPGQSWTLADVSYLATWVDTTDEAGDTHHQVVDIGAALPTCGHAPRLDTADCRAMEQALKDTVELLGDGDRILPPQPPTFTDPTGGEEAAAP